MVLDATRVPAGTHSSNHCPVFSARQPTGPARRTLPKLGVIVYSRGASRRLLIARAPAYSTLHPTTLERPSSRVHCYFEQPV
jgi:hypothetical protein